MTITFSKGGGSLMAKALREVLRAAIRTEVK